MIEERLRKADVAVIGGDIAQMIAAYKALQEITD